jgi:DNA gyrase subunit B/topoisomerase-4 subunit B
MASPTPTAAYDASSVEALEPMEHVRRRPGMYIGGTDKTGLHHLVREIVDNAVDEAINGHARKIEVTVFRDGRTVRVVDDGRGIPVDIHPKLGKPAVEVILTTLFSGAKFENKSYATSGGLHGVGSSVVNALSEQMAATIWRDGFEWSQEYRRGKPTSALRKGKSTRQRGTAITFTPDPEIFGDFLFDADLIRAHLDVCAYLNRGLRILFVDEGSERREELCHQGGLADLYTHLVQTAGSNPVVATPFTVEKEGEVRLQLALGWTDAPREKILTYVNGIPTAEGGTHEQGLKDALGKAIRNYIDTHEGSVPKGTKLTAEDIREGLVAALSIFIAQPHFQGQTKERLNNPEVRPAVDAIVRLAVERWLNDNRSCADAVLTRIVMAAKARVASRDASEQVRRKSPVNRRLNLPGKLADCSSSEAAECELFIVEGDSAGGSAKQGRDRAFQAILPLRGKVLNTESASLKKVLENNELSDVVSALGCGIGADFDVSRLRYSRIILLMDADSDGHHIATLLMTFFYRHLRPLIDKGHIFLARPPLFRIDAGKQTYWASSDAERDRIVKRIPARMKPEISRFKGLGEMMPKTLYETTLDPKKRRLLRVTIPDGEHMNTEQVVSDLMGKDAGTRYQEIQRWMADVDELDI